MKVSKQFTFEASHQISNHPGKCARLHGHSWLLTVECEGEINPATGMVVDFYDIKGAVQSLVDALDHTHLGSGLVDCSLHPDGSGGHIDKMWLGPSHEVSLPALPTSENLLWWLAGQLQQEEPEFLWSQLTLNETCTTSASLSRSEFVRWRLEQKGATNAETQGTQNAQDGQERSQEAQEIAQPLAVQPEVLEITDDDIPF